MAKQDSKSTLQTQKKQVNSDTTDSTIKTQKQVTKKTTKKILEGQKVTKQENVPKTGLFLYFQTKKRKRESTEDSEKLKKKDKKN